MVNVPSISVVLSTHNPHPGRLERTLSGLFSQNLAAADWELILVDNASTIPLSPAGLRLDRFSNSRLVREVRLGLAYGRLSGIQNSNGQIIVFVDDDNVLAPDYLHHAAEIFDRIPTLGTAGGKNLPEWEVLPESWAKEFFLYLALRDLGDGELLAAKGDPLNYPDWNPIGAGMAMGAGMIVRRDAISSWAIDPALVGRQGDALSSGEDLDIALHIFRAGWNVGYFPQLRLIHLIPAQRIGRRYLGRLFQGIAKAWVQVCSRYSLASFAPAAPWTLPLRKWRAYLRYRAWAGPAEYVRWKGACGIFDGRAELCAARKRSTSHAP